MKKKLLLFLAIGCFLSSNLFAQKVEWQTIEKSAKTELKGNTKLFFVDFYTSWCGWCKKMDRETFANPVVAKILNTYFIPVKFDAEGNAEFYWNGTKYNNAPSNSGRSNTHNFAKSMLGAKMGFPSFGIFSNNQERITIIQGYHPADEFVIMLWYFASGDHKRYAYEKYVQIFDKEIRPVMNEKLGIN